MALVSRYKHVKTGGTYRVMAVAKLQMADPALDMQEVTIYVSEKDNSIWVRLTSEFNDGRFEPRSSVTSTEKKTLDFKSDVDLSEATRSVASLYSLSATEGK
jgi:hypothetical protein